MAKKKKKTTDARKYLFALKGRTLYTLGQGKPNRIIKIDRKVVTVGTEKSPDGTALPIEQVQEALDRIHTEGKVAVNVKSLGHRSSFIGAVLATLPGAEVQENPTAVKLPKSKRKKPKKKPAKKAKKAKPAKPKKKRS